MTKFVRLAPACFGAISLAFCATNAFAQTTTSTFTSQIIIQNQCVIQSTNTLDFGTQGVLTANVDVTADIGVLCTSGAAYNIRLNAGSTAGGSIATRLMTDGTNNVSYQMFRNAARTQNWGESDGTDTVSSTGTGSAQTHTVFGRVPPQTTPPAATYTDTVTVTVAY